MNARRLLIPLAAAAFISVGAAGPAEAAYVQVNGGPQDFHTAVHRSTFYPFHRDGYQDTVSFEFWLDDSMTGTDYDNDCVSAQPVYTLVIRNQNGGAVRTITKTDTYSESIIGPYTDAYSTVINWNGKKDDGTMVKQGNTFSADLSMQATCEHSYGGSYDIDQVRTITGIKPTTGYRWVSKTLTKRGRYSTSHQATGDCYSRPDGYDWWLDCIDNNGVGKVTYKFTMLPHSQYHNWNWDGDWNGPDRGDSHSVNGRVVTVTIGTAAYAWQDIQHVWINYRHRIPI